MQRNKKGFFECRRKIKVLYPIHVPPNTLLSHKIVEDARQRYWIDRLRQLTKKIITSCYGYKKSQPKDRTIGPVPSEVVGVDYAGPISP